MTLSPLAGLLARKRLMIFDLDGTIVDSSPLHARAFNEAFAPEGVAVDYARIAGMTTDTAVDKVAGEAGLVLAPERRSSLIADKRARARRLIEAEVEALEGSLDFLARARGVYRLALCTSGSRSTVAATLRKIGVENWFDPLVAAEDVANGKPHPEGFLKALHASGMTADEALVFEDAESGLAAAAAAGIEAVHVTSGRTGGGLQADWQMLNAALREARP